MSLAGPASGMPGSSDRSLDAGGLNVVSAYDQDGDGTATVEAETAADAVRLVLGGTIETGGDRYTLTPDTISDVPADRTPFLLIETEAGFEIWLEGLAADPRASDWDYDDAAWFVTAEFAGPPTDPKPAPKPDPKTAVAKLAPDLIGHIKKATVKGNQDPTTPDTIEIATSGGHTSGTIDKEISDQIVINGQKRDIKVIITVVEVDPNVDKAKKPHEIRIVPTTADPDITNFVPKEGDRTNVVKTQFPTNWTQAQITAAILTALSKARAGEAGTTFTPDKLDPNRGAFEATVDGIRIRGGWEL